MLTRGVVFGRTFQTDPQNYRVVQGKDTILINQEDSIYQLCADAIYEIIGIYA